MASFEIARALPKFGFDSQAPQVDMMVVWSSGEVRAAESTFDAM